MVARALADLGYRVGDESEVLAAQSDNPRGYFERRDVVALNERILLDAGGTWYRPPAVEKLKVGDYDVELAELRHCLGDAPWLIKDPRLAISWPAWRRVFPDAGFVYVYRSPEAVARSLEVRNGFPLDYGLALWEYYNRLIISHIADTEYVAVAYENFAARPAEQLQAIAAALDLTAGGIVDSAERVFEASLNNSPDDAKLQEISQLKTAAQIDLEKTCAALLARTPIAEDASTIDDALLTRLTSMGESLVHSAQARQVRKQFDNLKDEHAALLEAHDRDQEELQFLRNRFADPEELGNKLAELEREQRSVQTTLEQTRGELQRTEQERQKLRENNDTKQLEIEGLQLEIERLQLERDTVSAQYAATHAELITEQDKNLQLHAGLSEAVQKERESSQQLSHVYTQLKAFLPSNPGRLVRGILALYKVITLRPNSNTALDDVFHMARTTSLNGAAIDTVKTPSRIVMAGNIVLYALRHPHSSWRSFSLARFKRLMQVLTRGHKEDVELWVAQRFPEQEIHTVDESTLDEDADLDSLQLTFLPPDNPMVSIVVPVHNQYRVTMNCLRSILEHTGNTSYEVILADDASSDLTVSIEQRVSGLILVRQQSNLGFLGNCNAAVQLAKGEYVLLLNNDTAVTAGWLEQLLNVFMLHADAGVVGPKLLYGDGRLQEAGGIVWSDASGWNYGKLDDPAAPQYNYLRRTDYVSGACLLTPKSLWEKIGGFDDRYSPAYYEDTDYCFAVRDAGYNVYYQPQCEIYHFEGISHGTDENSGIKQHQVVNKDRFAEKWLAELESFHFPNGEQIFSARDRSREARCILVIDHYVPSFDKDAGSRSTMMYLELMVEMGYNVKFLGANFFPHQPYTAVLQNLGIEVLYGEKIARNISEWLRDHASCIDVIYLHRPHVAEQFLDILNTLEPRPPIIYFGHDLHYLRTTREAELRDSADLLEEAAAWKRREYSVFDQVDTIYYPSTVEIDAIRAEREDAKLRAIPLFIADSVHDDAYQSESRQGLLFVGGFNHPPNVDGVAWLVAEILPLIRSADPTLQVHIAGSNAPEAITALEDEPGVIFHGYLTDEELANLYRGVLGVIVPLRFGAGVKGKVVEALQWGLPIVTTSIGAEGLPEPEEVFEVADSAERFAAAMLAVHRGDAGALQRVHSFPEYLRRNFGRDVIRSILIEDFGAPDKALH